MTPQVEQSAHEMRGLRTRERVLGAAIAEFKLSGLAGADVNTVVASDGVAHGIFSFHFPSEEHVLRELEYRDVGQFGGDCPTRP